MTRIFGKTVCTVVQHFLKEVSDNSKTLQIFVTRSQLLFVMIRRLLTIHTGVTYPMLVGISFMRRGIVNLILRF